jgi:hypothetical protein
MRDTSSRLVAAGPGDVHGACNATQAEGPDPKTCGTGQGGRRGGLPGSVLAGLTGSVVSGIKQHVELVEDG